MASDPTYLAFIRRQDCCAPGCEGSTWPVVAHHHTRGKNRRGKSQKSDDRETIPLHHDCHMALHSLSGPFKGWDKARLREFQDGQVELFQGMYFSNVFDKDGGQW